jgi:hypothetical protein
MVAAKLPRITPPGRIGEADQMAANVSIVHDVPEPLAAQACPRPSRTLPSHSLRGKAARKRGRCVK